MYFVFFQAYLNNAELGNNVEEVESHIKKHDAFYNILTGQDPKVITVEIVNYQ